MRAIAGSCRLPQCPVMEVLDVVLVVVLIVAGRDLPEEKLQDGQQAGLEREIGTQRAE